MAGFAMKTKRKPQTPSQYGRAGSWAVEAMAVSPLAAGRLDPPDCLIYATPAQMILFINGLQWTGFKNGVGLCGRVLRADSWGSHVGG